MLDQMILTVSDIKRSLAFYEAALKPLQIGFFMPYKGEDGHPDLVPETTFLPAHDWNTIRGTTPPMYSIRTGTRSRSYIRASPA
jgi:hypothetical protein